MFRKFISLIDTKDSFLELCWVQKINGLVRVAIFDEVDSRAFVVVFIEKQNQYSLIAFDTTNGKIQWTSIVRNGGYGSPALIEDTVVFPTNFTNIVAFSKLNGELKWEFETKCRIRSPINIIEDSIYFSSGNEIFALNPKGQLVNKWEKEGAFFYGTIDIINGMIISLGTFENDKGESTVKIFAFYKNGKLLYEIPLYLGPIISADTSGIVWQKNIGFVGGDNCIISFDGENGRIRWVSKVHGFAGRQICTVNNEYIYYVTQSGIIGALQTSNGAHAWNIKTNDDALVAPISMLGTNLIVLADAHLNIFKSSSGELIQKIPVGHSPYSMVSLSKEYAILGAGEPPHNGLLIGLKLKDELKENFICSVSLSNAYIENASFNLLLSIFNTPNSVLRVELDGALFNLKNLVEGEKISDTSFAFKLPIPPTMCSGDYVMPLYLHLDSGKSISRLVAVKLQRKHTLPSKAYLNHIPDIVQEQPKFSGAAIGVAIKKLYGDVCIKQTDMRDMVEASLSKANYASHEIWRLIFRRILTSKARKVNELPEFNKHKN